MLSWEAALESADGDVVIVTLYLIVHPSTCSSRLLVSPLLTWTKIEGNPGVEEPCYS